jgi:hypothetical protein
MKLYKINTVYYVIANDMKEAMKLFVIEKEENIYEVKLLDDKLITGD